MIYSIKIIDGSRYEIDKEPFMTYQWDESWLTFYSDNVKRMINIRNIASIKVIEE